MTPFFIESFKYFKITDLICAIDFRIVFLSASKYHDLSFFTKIFSGNIKFKSWVVLTFKKIVSLLFDKSHGKSNSDSVFFQEFIHRSIFRFANCLKSLDKKFNKQYSSYS